MESSLTGPDASGNPTPLDDASGQPLDLTKNASQLTTDYETVDKTAISTLSPCTTPSTVHSDDPHYGVSLTDEQLPSNLLAAHAPDLKYWELADRLGLGTLKPCWEAYLPASNPGGAGTDFYYSYGVEWQYTPAATKADPTPSADTVYQSKNPITIHWGNGDLWGVIGWCWNEDVAGSGVDCYDMGVPGYPDPGYSLPLSTMLPDPTMTASGSELKAIEASDNAELSYLREQMAQSVVGDGADPALEKDGNLSHTGALGTAADTLTGVRDLLNSYVEFALAPALQADSTLRSLIDGADQLPGEADLQNAFDGVETNGTLGDPVASLNTAEATNRTSLTDELAALISGIGSSPAAADHALLGSDDLFDADVQSPCSHPAGAGRPEFEFRIWFGVGIRFGLGVGIRFRVGVGIRFWVGLHWKRHDGNNRYDGDHRHNRHGDDRHDEVVRHDDASGDALAESNGFEDDVLVEDRHDACLCAEHSGDGDDDADPCPEGTPKGTPLRPPRARKSLSAHRCCEENDVVRSCGGERGCDRARTEEGQLHTDHHRRRSCGGCPARQGALIRPRIRTSMKRAHRVTQTARHDQGSDCPHVGYRIAAYTGWSH